MDLDEGGAAGAHFEGAFDAGEKLGVWHPAVGGVGGAIAAGADFDGLTFESDWGRAWDTSMFEDEVAESAFGVCRGLAALFFVGDVDEEFDDAPVLSFGDGVGEGVDDDVSIAEEGFVVDGVVEVAGETGIVPEEDALRFVFVAGGVDEFVELVAGDGGAA